MGQRACPSQDSLCVSIMLPSSSFSCAPQLGAGRTAPGKTKLLLLYNLVKYQCSLKVGSGCQSVVSAFVVLILSSSPDWILDGNEAVLISGNF